MPEFDSTVEYRNIPDFPGYCAGSDGSVWCCRNRNGCGRMGPWRELRQTLDAYGYPQVIVYRNTKRYCRKTHRLVLEAFVGPRPTGMDCRHFPDQRRNANVLGNIRWDTKQANCADKLLNGTDQRGERNGSAKLKAKAVRGIRNDYATGLYSQRQLAKKYTISQTTIGNIVRRTHWQYL